MCSQQANLLGLSHCWSCRPISNDSQSPSPLEPYFGAFLSAPFTPRGPCGRRKHSPPWEACDHINKMAATNMASWQTMLHVLYMWCHVIAGIPWNLSFCFIFHEKKTPNDAVTPQRQSQFTPKMEAKAVSRLLSSLVWINWPLQWM